MRRALLLTLLLAGCGWHLQGQFQLPPSTRVALLGLPVSDPLMVQLRERLARSGGEVLFQPEGAQVVLRILDARAQRRELALDEHGRAVEYQLRYLIDFQIERGGKVKENRTRRAPSEKPLVVRDRIEVVRQYFNPQLQIIGKVEEESRLWEEMRREAASRLLDRLRFALKQDKSTFRPL